MGSLKIRKSRALRGNEASGGGHTGGEGVFQSLNSNIKYTSYPFATMLLMTVEIIDFLAVLYQYLINTVYILCNYFFLQLAFS